MSIGDMNKRIKLIRYEKIKTDTGGLQATPVEEYTVWAKVDNRNGMPMTSEGNNDYRYDKKFKFRAYESRVITSQFFIEDDGQLYKIGNLVKENEGKLKYYTARCESVTNV